MSAGPTGAAPMPCREVVELVTAYMEAALPEEERERLESHLRDCEPCQVYLRQVEATIRAVGASAETLHESGAMRGLLEVFRAWKRGSDGRPDRLGGPA